MSGQEFLDDQTKRMLNNSPVQDNSVLTFKDLRFIRMAMIEVSVHWYSIGLQLGVDMSTLDKIRSAHRRDVDRCLTLVIGEWLKNSKKCTWTKVVIAVSARVGGDNPALASRIAKGCKTYGSKDTFLELDKVDNRPLTSASTKFVVAALAEGVADKWDSVGIFLGIPYKVIERCRLEDTLDERIQELTSAWIGRKYEVESYGEPSWRKLIEAIGHKAGGYHRRLASKLAADHPVLADEPSPKVEEAGPVSPPTSAGASAPTTFTAHSRESTEVLTEADLPALVNALAPVASKWNPICLQLGVPYSKLLNIEAQPMRLSGAPRTFLQDGLYEWLQRSTGTRTITSLCTALKEPSVGEPVVAIEVEETLRNHRGLPT